jgi:hypothetical protein
MATIAPLLATSAMPRPRSRMARLPHGSGIIIAIAFSTIFWLGVLVLVL